jgi:hypothetical protein
LIDPKLEAGVVFFSFGEKQSGLCQLAADHPRLAPHYVCLAPSSRIPCNARHLDSSGCNAVGAYTSLPACP